MLHVACQPPFPVATERRIHGVLSRRSLAARIDAAIGERNASELARKIGVKPGSISNWRTGFRMPDPERLARLCDEIKASADELLGLKPFGGRPPTPPVDESAPVPQLWVPLVADVAAGEPTLEQRSEPDDFYSFKAKWVERVVKRSGSSPDRLFAVKVRRGKGGDSMLPTIRPGASLVVDPGPAATGIASIESGRVYVVRPSEGGGGWTVKRAWLDKHYLVLKGDNPEVPAIVEDVRGKRLRDLVVGKVVYVGQEEE